MHGNGTSGCRGDWRKRAVSPFRYRPALEPFFTALITLEARGAGTKHTAIARHGDEVTRKKHEEMGLHEGWGQTLDQLVTLMKTKK